MVEVAKALSVNARLIIMDEPTSSLTAVETQILMDLIRKLKASGVSIVFISHKLNEIFEISDRISVLRDGEYVGCVDTAQCSNDMLIRMMVGREITDIFPKKEVPLGEVVLSVKHLNAGKAVQDVSFELRRGEILGFAGLVGAGRSETMRAIFGVDRVESGEIVVDGVPLPVFHHPKEAISAGLAFLPEDRQMLGLILGMTVRENTTIAGLEKTLVHYMINDEREAEITQKYIELLGVRARSTEQTVANLSGGNQQKVVLAKWLHTDPKVLILDEPTRGIDVGAKKEIHTLITAFRGLDTHRKLVIAGVSSDTDSYVRKLKALAAGDDRILFTGFVEGRLLAELYSNAFLYILPSQVEGMPISLLEAMSYGNCCLVSDIPELTEVVGNHGVTVPCGDSLALRQRLEQLLNDPATVAGYKAAAAEAVLNKYNWDDVVRRTLEVYR